MSNNTCIQMITTLVEIVAFLPIGTNLALLHLLWAMVSGQFLVSRGAIFSALVNMGLSNSQVRRAWQAFYRGGWCIGELLVRWETIVMRKDKWKARYHGGYCALAVDLTGFWRPTLKNCPSTHYHHGAGKALPAIVLGLIGRVGQIDTQRLALPLAIERLTEESPDEVSLMKRLVGIAKKIMTALDVLVLDGGFSLAELQEQQIERYVVKVAKNFTARRSVPAKYKEKGRRPERGEIVRPLARTYREKTLEATPPDRTVTWQDEQGMELKAQVWDNLVLTNTPASEFAAASKGKAELPTFKVMAFFDPKFASPLLVATTLKIEEKYVRLLYLDRWAIEQIPLAAKQMVGAEQSFVSEPESCQRLPELGLLTGSILSFEAAQLPPIPTGFWDKKPRSTPGRLRRILYKLGFPSEMELPAQIRQKASVTNHLPKGFWGQKGSSTP